MKFVLLTGPPGIGKTTLVQKVLNEIQQTTTSTIMVTGFLTKELRDPVSKKRTGFDIVSLSQKNKGETAPLARIKVLSTSKSGPTVGNYVVDIQSFESVALPAIASPKESALQLCIIDEIGKMELFSKKFAASVRQIFSECDCTVLATVPLLQGQGLSLVEELKRRSDVKLIEVARENRDSLVSEVTANIRNCLGLA